MNRPDAEMRGQAAGAGFDPTTTAAFVSTDVTRVTLVRHGEVERLGERVVRGQLDVPLSAAGRRQGQELRRWFAANVARPTGLVSSDLVRCRELALELGGDWGLEPRLDPKLREQSMGAWQGATWAEIQARFGSAINDYWDDYAHARPPEGESLTDLAQRVATAFDALMREYAGGHLVLVTHIGVIRCVLCRALGLELDQALRFAPATASVTELLVSEGGVVLEAFGERPWLRAGGGDAGSTAGPPHQSVAAGAAPTRVPRRCIALSGSAGAGKTTLGRALADELGVPFIEEGMRRRLEAGLDLHTLDFDAWRVLSWELWHEQRAAEESGLRAAGGFVADRSSLDFAAFWLHYGLFEDAAETGRYLSEMRAAAARYERVLLCPWGVLPLAADGVRSTNPWLQLRFQGIVENLHARFTPDGSLARVPATVDFAVRLAFARASLA